MKPVPSLIPKVLMATGAPITIEGAPPVVDRAAGPVEDMAEKEDRTGIKSEII
jgi:hypothetical protein